jgi:putative Mg2+ transporter-C (MgtC) family protein
MMVLQSGQSSDMEHALPLLSSLLPTQPGLEQLFSKMLARLMVAAVLGGVVGVEREIKRRPAGLRTNMFICFGAAMYTVLSLELGGTNEATRIASQIIPGIGFIGAGSILREKGGVTGLTTAATIFVVASMGMACGAGFYLLAIFATVLLLVALQLLGWLERRLNWKPLMMNYSVITDKSPQEIVEKINNVLEDQEKQLSGLRLATKDGKQCVEFSVSGTRHEQQDLLNYMRQSDDLRNVQSNPGPEVD